MPSDPRIDTYLSGLPDDQREILTKLRADIARLAPDAVETMAYGMPAYRLGGKFFLSFAGWKRHCSIYPINDDLLARHAATVGSYGHTKGGLHFSKERPLPDELLEDLIRDRTGQIGGAGGY